MVLIKVYDETEKHYFSSKAKAAQWLETYNQYVQYAIKYNKKLKGWMIEYDEDPDVRNYEIDNFLG